MPIKSLDAFATGMSFPPESEIARLHRYEQNTLLFEGEHDQVWQESTRALRPELMTVQRFVLDFHGRLSTHWADMVFGEAPTFNAGDEESREQKALEELISRNNLLATAYEVCIDRSMLGDGLLKLRLEEGLAVIEGQPPDYWYPIVSPENIRRVEAHVLAWTFTHEKKQYVRLEIHTVGQIEHRVHLLKGNKIEQDVTEEFLEGRKAIEKTGVTDFLIVQVPGLRTTKNVYGRDDYGRLDTIVMELEDRLAQMSRILDKHADPGMYGPDSALEFNQELQKWEFKKENYLVLTSKEDPVPGYLTWDGDLNSAVGEFNLLFEQLLFLAETSPAAFSLLKQGMAESGSALKRLMMADVAKAARITRAFDPALTKALRLASQLERANGRRDTPELLNVSIEWHDGLPEDLTESSAIAERGVREGFISRYTAIKLMHPTWREKQILEELDRLAEDAASKASSMPGFGMPAVLGGPAEDPGEPGDTGEDAGGGDGGNPGDDDE